MASLPRPSRPSQNPPTAPLPSIPLPKSRQSSIQSSSSIPGASAPPTSALPQPPSARNSSSSIQGTPSNAPTKPLPSLPTPTANGTAASLTPAKSLRRNPSNNNINSTTPTAQRTPSVRSTSSSAVPTPRSGTPRSSLLNDGSKSVSGLARPSLAGSVPIAEDEPVVEQKEGADSPEEPTEDPMGADFDDPPRGRPTSTTKEKGNVVISVRVRPEPANKDGNAESGEWMVDGRRGLVAFKGKEGGDYFYDNVFTTHDKNNRVYDSSAKRLVRRVMEGYHGTVFAYGMTGTGKTFSMQGTATSPGVIPLAITDIFSFIRETPHREFLLRVSYLEIYNEKIHDLLAIPAGQGPGIQPPDDIKLREDSKRGVYATPLKEEIVQSPTQLLRVIARGDHARRTSSTQFNARSSRSHAVVQIVVESRERNSLPGSKPDKKRSEVVPGGVRVSTLSLIDLAGSERAADNKERRTEGAHINKSLLTLGNVISKLSGNKDKQGNPTDKDGKHLPYRDSKLTRLLQSALSGNSLISILCTLQMSANGSSAAQGNHTMETLNTLKFAARARNNIVSHAKKAEEAHGNLGEAGRALLDRYRLEIMDLRKQLEGQHQQKDGTSTDKEEKGGAKDEEPEKEDDESEKPRDKEDEDRHEEQMLEMQLARTALKERIEHLNRLILSSKSIGVNASRSSTNLRNSAMSTADSLHSGSRSLRSSASTHTLDPSQFEARNRGSAGSLRSLATHRASTMHDGEGDDEDDSFGENGDGTATLHAQISNLQADLSDKNRYIATLEKRLIQARRSSQSRVSMTFAPRNPLPSAENGGVEALIRDKDAEIAELRARLDDKDRMLGALKSAARKRDTADSNRNSGAYVDRSTATSPSGGDAASVYSGPPRSRSSLRNSNGHGISPSGTQERPHSSLETSSSSLSRNGAPPSPSYAAFSHSPAGPVGKLMQLGSTSPPPTGPRRNHGVDEMTRMLDEMIRQKAESASAHSRGESTASSAFNGSSSGKRHSLLNGMNGINGLNSGSPDANGVSYPPPSRSARASTRFSTDPTKLSGWESDVARRRASLMGQFPTTPTGTGSFPTSPREGASPRYPDGSRLESRASSHTGSLTPTPSNAERKDMHPSSEDNSGDEQFDDATMTQAVETTRSGYVPEYA